MKTFHKSTFSILLLLFFLFSCQNDDNSIELTYSKTDLRILIVGNSITHHSPAPNLGWYGDWGMAASAPDKDFKSLYTQKLEKHLNKRKVFVSSKNISAWENDFNYNLNEYVDISNKVYDILIVRLGENVSTQSYQLSNYGYALKQMINHFKTSDTEVIITGNIWNSPEKDRIQKKVANDNGYTFISLSDFRKNPANFAYGKFENNGVSAHPSDIGMANLSNLLFTATIIKVLKNNI